MTRLILILAAFYAMALGVKGEPNNKYAYKEICAYSPPSREQLVEEARARREARLNAMIKKHERDEAAKKAKEAAEKEAAAKRAKEEAKIKEEKEVADSATTKEPSIVFVNGQSTWEAAKGAILSGFLKNFLIIISISIIYSIFKRRKRILPTIKSLFKRKPKYKIVNVDTMESLNTQTRDMKENRISTKKERMGEGTYRIFKVAFMALFWATLTFYVVSKAISERYYFSHNLRGFVYDRWTNELVKINNLDELQRQTY